MKKYCLLLLIFFGLFISGCTENGITTYNNGTETTTESQEVDIDKNYTVSVVDLTEDYDFSATELTIYEYQEDPDIPYVDIEDFLDILSEGLIEIDIIKGSNDIALSYDIYVSQTEYFTVELTIDATENTLYYNDFNFSSSIGLDTTDYETSISLVDVVVNTVGQAEKMIDLDDYDFDVLLIDGSYQISFFLANLLLSGDLINLYFNSDEVFIFDDIEAVLNEVEDFDLPKDFSESNLVKHCTNYSALLFDNFYGLKEEFGYTDFVSEFEDLELYSSKAINEFDEIFTGFIYELDELHTNIIDYGYDKDEVEQVVPETNTRITNFYYNLTMGNYFYKDYDIEFSEADDFYLLDIIEFNLETKDKLAGFFRNLNPNKKIIVNLTTCTGGNLISVLELLAYVTNDSINLNYKNPATGESYTESYQSSNIQALENEFQFYTSYATYSAANLLVSLVKDNDLGLVFGAMTGGGAAAVNYTVLPNNMILTYSTNFLLLNDSLEVIEMGIDPDVYQRLSTDINATDNEVNGYLMRYGDIRVVSTDTTSKDINLELVLDSVPNDATITGYEIKIFNKDGIELLFYQKILEPSEFAFTHSFDDYKELIYIQVNCFYEMDGLERVETICKRTIDDMADDFTVNTVTVPIGRSYQANRYAYSDDDFIKIEIAESGVYSIAIDNDSHTSHKVYDLEGNLIDEYNYFALTPGTYIVELDNIRKIGDYNIFIERIYDDCAFGQEITLVEGSSNSVTVQYDYEEDVEWIEFTLLEEAYVTISVNTSISSFYIAYLDGTEYNNATDRLRNTDYLDFVFPKGTFMLGFLSNNADFNYSITASFDVEYIDNDYSGDIFLTDDNYGTLVEGENLITLDGNCDQDIYEYEVTEATDLMIDGFDQVRTCLITDEGKDCRYSTELYHLEPGVHHFMFFAYGVTDPVTLRINVIVLADETSMTNMLPIQLDQEFTVVIEWDDDIDYFTLSLTEATAINIVLEDGHSAHTIVYIDDGLWTKVIERSYDEFNFQLPPGNYIIAIGENISNLDTVETYYVTLNTIVSDDIDPGMTGLLEDSYRTLDFQTTTQEQITGSIDYEGDWDIFRINVIDAGTYNISSLSDESIQIYCILENGEWDKISFSNYTFTEGIHYIIVRRTYDQGETDYTLYYSLKS